MRDIKSVWIVKGPDGSIASVWPSEKEAKEEANKFNREVQGNVFTVEKNEIKEFINE